MSHRILAALLCASIPAAAHPQACPPGGVYLSHDKLPQVPMGPTFVAVVPGLCENVFAQFWGRDSVATGSYVSDGIQYAVGP